MHHFPRLALCAGVLILIASLGLADSKPKEFSASQRRWWAFQKVVKPAAPDVKDRAWARNTIDAFIARKLEEKGISPNPPADKVTLIRRASLDITGLPPSPEEVQTFL